MNIEAPALTRAIIEHLSARKAPGSIINTSSVLGTIASPLLGAYGMSKAALISMTKTLAVELSGTGIASTPSRLASSRQVCERSWTTRIRDSIVNKTAARRVGVPKYRRRRSAHLASDESSVTGHVLVIDGGGPSGVFLQDQLAATSQLGRPAADDLELRVLRASEPQKLFAGPLKLDPHECDRIRGSPRRRRGPNKARHQTRPVS